MWAPEREVKIGKNTETAIVTGGSQGIGAGLVKAFLDRGYNVVANSRNITTSGVSARSSMRSKTAVEWNRTGYTH